MNRKLKYLLGIASVWLLLHLSYTVIDGLKQPSENADIAVILGNKVNPDGSLSTRLQKRVECGMDLYRAHRVKKLLVSGGFGAEGFYEGTKMKAYLSSHGVPDTAIIVDNNGNNTMATVENTLKITDSLHFKTIVIVSQFYHITRTKMLFRKRNCFSIQGASPRYFERRDFYSILREFLAFYIELIRY